MVLVLLFSNLKIFYISETASLKFSHCQPKLRKKICYYFFLISCLQFKFIKLLSFFYLIWYNRCMFRFILENAGTIFKLFQ